MENHVNTTNLTDEQLREYHLSIKAQLGQLAIYDADCQQDWDRRYPPK